MSGSTNAVIGGWDSLFSEQDRPVDVFGRPVCKQLVLWFHLMLPGVNKLPFTFSWIFS